MRVYGFKKDEQLLGSLKEALSYGANTFMFYTGAPQNTKREKINLDLVKQGQELMKENGIGYGAVNHPVDRDPICGYTGIIKELCPCCGRKEFEEPKYFTERLRRNTKYNCKTI